MMTVYELFQEDQTNVFTSFPTIENMRTPEQGNIPGSLSFHGARFIRRINPVIPYYLSLAIGFDITVMAVCDSMVD